MQQTDLFVCCILFWGNIRKKMQRVFMVFLKMRIFARNKILTHKSPMSFIADKVVMDGLTYDDVLLIPAYSEVLPKAVELSTKFSRNIDLKIPFAVSYTHLTLPTKA